LDSIRDEENKLGSYKTVVEGGKMVLQREFTYGLNEKHYTSEAEREKNKNKFYSFMKQMDMQIKLTDNHLAEIRAIKMNKTQAISSMFLRKSTQQTADEKPTEASLEQAMDLIIKKQAQRKLDDIRFQEAKRSFNLTDNDETHKLLKGLETVTSKSFAACTKVNRLRRLNDRGNRQI